MLLREGVNIASSSRAGGLQTFPPSADAAVAREPLSHGHAFGVPPHRFDETSVPLMSTPDSIGRAGGEVGMVLAGQSVLEQARGVKLEMRRPEYLKRLKRSHDGTHNDGHLTRPSVDNNERLGVTTTPVKGRRLQLFDFKETSAESFEESLMTHGYGTFGSERAPQRRISPSDGRNQEAVEWLTNNPSAVGQANDVHTPVPDPQPETILTDKEIKKRKRLEAFKSLSIRPLSKLRPVELEGKGRVLVDMSAEELEDLQSTPAKKRATARKKRGGAVDRKGKIPARRVGATGGSSSSTERSNAPEVPHWLDAEFPWCLRVKEREENLSAEQSDRLIRIDRYLSRNTDSDEGEDGEGAALASDEEVMPSSAWGQVYEDPPMPPRRGRGKMVPLKADPEPRTPTRRWATTVPERTQNVFFPSDPADARAALLSKRTVRQLEKRRHRRMYLGEARDGGIACLCGQGNEEDGRPAVQCDDCLTWHHLECIGVQDESELGDEDDPWYCGACNPRGWRHNARALTPEPPTPEQVTISRQPTFVPTDDRPLPTRHHDIALYSSSPQQPSPFRDWTTTSLRTPLHQKRRTGHDGFLSRSIWDDGAQPGPSTPPSSSGHGRIHSTPSGRFDEDNADVSGFQTPARGHPLGMSFATPKNTSASSLSGGFAFGGPFASPRGMTTRNALDDSVGGSAGGVAHMRSLSSYSAYVPTFDDTPIRRTAPQGIDRVRGVHVHGPLFESPLATRGGGSSLLVGGVLSGGTLEESPIVRSSDVGSRKATSHGEGDEDARDG